MANKKKVNKLVGRPLIRNDNNPNWTSNERFSIIADMINTSSRIEGLLNAIKDPIKTAIWKVKDNGASARVVKYVEDWLFNELNFYKLLNDVLKYLDYGSMIFEKVYVPKKGRHYIELQPRYPYTILTWNVDTEKNKIISVTQMTAGGSVEIPYKKLFLIVNDWEGLTPIGKPIVRTLYRDFVLEREITVAAATGLKRNLMGIPVAHYPDSITADDEKQILEMLQQITVSDKAYFAEKGDVEFRFQAIEGNLPKPDGLLDYLWQSTNASQSANMLSLATSNRGSRAVGNSLAPPFYNRIAAIARDISMAFNELIKEAVEINFNTDKYPTIVASGISAKDFSDKAYALAALKDVVLNDLTPEEKESLKTYIFEAFEIPIGGKK